MKEKAWRNRSFSIYLGKEEPENTNKIFEIGIVISGVKTCQINDVHHQIKEREVFFLMPYDSYWNDYTYHQEQKTISILFSKKWIESFLADDLGMLNQRARVASFSENDWEQMLFLCEQLIKEQELRDRYSEKVEKIYLHNIIILFMRNLKEEAPIYAEELSLMKKSREYIRKHFKEQITLDDVATYTGYTNAYFSRKFHAVFGESYKSYLIRLRCEYAQEMLTNTNLSVTEICYKSGFASISNFQKSFKEICGVTPKAWRKKQTRREQ
ncbi:MAG: helix-turn-helix transcriptional regulator [Clostridia bacterium]|nr:helix-turn-helix transcriptional regulator [Clostridia bacterium]